tara:strand:+ start:41 stop:937 length:897 start_codon:yes stop_codon:yes gene_type:complete
MATINLGSIKFNWKGDYAAGTAYAIDDVVNSSGTSYVCVAASTGNAPPNATYWNVMAQGGSDGSDGTDLTSTLTAQGDILYRDGSGLAKLGAGTSGQALLSGGAGANPSWGSAGSSTLLGSGESSNVTSQVINNSVLSSAYEEFVIYTFISKASGGGGGQKEMFVSTDNGSSTMNVDRLYHFAQLYPGGGTGHGVSAAAVNADRLHLNVSSATGDFHNGKITILRPSFASAGERNRNTILSEAVSSQNPGSTVNVENLTSWACIHDGNGNRMSNIDYVRFEMNGAGFDIKWAVYGRKW